MKKGQIAEGTVNKVEFPNKGIVYTDEGERIIVKIRFRDREFPLRSIRFAKERQRRDCLKR